MPRFVSLFVRGLLVALCALGALTPLICQAEDTSVQTLLSAFNKSQTQARYWQYGWTGFYTASLGYNIYQANEADSQNNRYDARVSAVTSALGLAGLWYNPLLYSPARQALEAIKRNPHLSQSEKDAKSLPLLIEVANDEASRQSWKARIAPFIVNLAAGLVIGVGDHRPGAGALQFGLGMAVSELRIRTQPTQVTDAWEPSQSVSLDLGGTRQTLHYAWMVNGHGLAFAMIF